MNRHFVLRRALDMASVLNATVKNYLRLCTVAVGLLAVGFASWMIAEEQRTVPELTVHEWGTFTAIAGNDGRAVEWMPFVNPNELPSFVEHLGAVSPKAGLRGTIRMETPVLYFYSPREVDVSVKARFSKGIITEWYPHAAQVRPHNVVNTELSQMQTDGTIRWDSVAVSPNLSADFPREPESSRYYAARETSSTPLHIKTAGRDQREKFLFYRGVSAASLPLSTTQSADGKLLVKNLAQDAIPAMILFERRGQRVGYRVLSAPENDAVLDPPELTGSVDSLCAELQGILFNQGLYSDEAHAMVETWRDSWFEEGSRLIYIVPRGFTDHILPLTINPTPATIVRVFVGRMEIVTPATARAVEAAMASNDGATLNKYGRFLQPILQIAREQ